MKIRSRHHLHRHKLTLPTLPFLAIMLGLMSVMALTTIAISVEKRRDIQETTVVELVGVPADFVPFHIRCKHSGAAWLDDQGVWQEFSISDILAMYGESAAYGGGANTDWDSPFMQFLTEKIEENKILSFVRKQNTLILWVEPEGIDVAALIQYVVSKRDFPLRVGLLPVMEGEDILDDRTIR